MDKVTVSRAVSRLLAAGRIRRRIADADKRRSILELSAEGWRIYREIAPRLLAFETDLLAVLDHRERRQLDCLLRRLADKAGEMEAPESG
jgi:DNA-binding MarR family transcriptional regulator